MQTQNSFRRRNKSLLLLDRWELRLKTKETKHQRIPTPNHIVHNYHDDRGVLKAHTKLVARYTRELAASLSALHWQLSSCSVTVAQPKYPTTRRCDSRQTAAAVGCSLPEKDGGAACRCRTVAVLGSNSDPPCDRLRPPADLQLALHRWSLQALTSLACDWPRPTTALCIYILHSTSCLCVSFAIAKCL